MSIRIMQADARHLPLDDNTVDLVITSPPYFGLRSYQDGGEHYDGQIGAEPTPAAYVDNLLAVTRECMRVLKPSGSLWVNLGDKYSGAQAQNYGGTSRAGESSKTWQQTNPKNTGIPNKSLMGIPWRYALACIDQLGLILRAEVIWAKPNGLPESVRDRVRRSHEQWFHFTLEPRYYSAVDEIREPHVTDPKVLARLMSVHSDTDGHNTRNRVGEGRHKMGQEHPLGKLPGSVWTIATEPLKLPADLDVDHFAAFPTEHPFRIVRGWSPPDGVVLDPFGGTGTTAHVAHALGRHAIHNDMSADYNRIAAHPEVIAKRAAKVAKKLAARPAVADKPQQGELHAAQLLLQHIAERP